MSRELRAKWWVLIAIKKTFYKSQAEDMSVISFLNETRAVSGLCWGLFSPLGGKILWVYAHAPFFWPPQLTKEQTATSTAHFPKSPTIWRNLRHDLQQHVLATGLLCPRDWIINGHPFLPIAPYVQSTHWKWGSMPRSAHTKCTHKSCWNGITNSRAGTSLLG